MDIASDSPPDPGARMWLLIAASASVLASAGLLAVGRLGVHVAGYILASLVSFTCVAFFRRHATRRTLVAGIAMQRSAVVLSTAVLVLGLALAVAHAYAIGRQFG